MNEIKCIIVEDEPLAAKVLIEYIDQVPFLKLQAKFKDAIYAITFLQDNKSDLIFLDIHLPKLKGLAFLRTLSQPPTIIVTTAYPQYAIESFDLKVTDYLLKPIEFERFLSAVNRVKDQQVIKKIQLDKVIKDHLFINVQKKKIKVLFDEILYIESQKEYIKIVTTKKVYFPKLTTNEMESLLPENLFKRIHRSYIISLNKIDAYNSEMVEINSISIPIGKSYKFVLNDY